MVEAAKASTCPAHSPRVQCSTLALYNTTVSSTEHFCTVLLHCTTAVQHDSSTALNHCTVPLHCTTALQLCTALMHCIAPLRCSALHCTTALSTHEHLPGRGSRHCSGDMCRDTLALPWVPLSYPPFIFPSSPFFQLKHTRH